MKFKIICESAADPSELESPEGELIKGHNDNTSGLSHATDAEEVSSNIRLGGKPLKHGGFLSFTGLRRHHAVIFLLGPERFCWDLRPEGQSEGKNVSQQTIRPPSSVVSLVSFFPMSLFSILSITSAARGGDCATHTHNVVELHSQEIEFFHFVCEINPVYDLNAFLSVSHRTTVL